MTLFLLLLAILPVILLLFFIYAKDSYEKEPLPLLVGLFFLGVGSAIPAVLLEQLLESVIDPMFGVPRNAPTYAYYFIMAFIGVAIVEEFVKFMAAFFITWNHPAFNFKFDGIVYCFYSSMGFALIENILYIFGQSSGGLKMAIGRALLAIPAHGMFSVFMGYYYGEAKYNKVIGNKDGVTKNILRGFFTAAALHGFYDFCLFTQKILFIVIFLAFVIVADIITIRKILLASKKNTAIYNMPVYQQYWVYPAPGYGAPGLMNPAYAQGAPAYGQPPMGQPAYGQAPNAYGQPPMGQPGYGAAPMNQAPYAQGAPAYIAAPMGQQQAYSSAQPQGAPGAYNQAPYAQASGTSSQAPTAPQAAYGQAPAAAPMNQAPAGQAPNQAPAYGQAASVQSAYDQNAQPAIPQPEETTSILRREAPRMIYCPNCHNICNFNSFFCGKCSSPIHSYGQQA